MPPHRLEAEGPFGEYTGFMGEEGFAPVFELRCVTERRAALYHDYGSCLPDALVPDNMLIEAKLYQIARTITPEVCNVYVPISGRRFHAYLSVGEINTGTARALLEATLAYRRVKLVVLVNDEVDIFDEQQMLWAIATRTQMDRDALILSDLPGSRLDPSLEPGQVNTAKMGIDARWKAAVRPQRNRVPAAVLEAMSKVSSQTNTIP